MPEPNKPEPNVLPVQNKMEVTSMYYSSGNYEAFARPRKPEGVDRKSAYIIGSGLAALTAACYLVRDGQMKGERVHVFEKDPLPGGACDGYKYDVGYVMREKSTEIIPVQERGWNGGQIDSGTGGWSRSVLLYRFWNQKKPGSI